MGGLREKKENNQRVREIESGEKQKGDREERDVGERVREVGKGQEKWERAIEMGIRERDGKMIREMGVSE